MFEVEISHKLTALLAFVMEFSTAKPTDIPSIAGIYSCHKREQAVRVLIGPGFFPEHPQKLDKHGQQSVSNLQPLIGKPGLHDESSIIQHIPLRCGFSVPFHVRGRRVTTPRADAS